MDYKQYFNAFKEQLSCFPWEQRLGFKFLGVDEGTGAVRAMAYIASRVVKGHGMGLVDNICITREFVFNRADPVNSFQIENITQFIVDGKNVDKQPLSIALTAALPRNLTQLDWSFIKVIITQQLDDLPEQLSESKFDVLLKYSKWQRETRVLNMKQLGLSCYDGITANIEIISKLKRCNRAIEMTAHVPVIFRPINREQLPEGKEYLIDAAKASDISDDTQMYNLEITHEDITVSLKGLGLVDCEGKSVDTDILRKHVPDYIKEINLDELLLTYLHVNDRNTVRH